MPLLGESGRAVELDESSFRRKFNRGRILKGQQWIFGLTERGTGFKRTLFFPVQNRSADTLLPIIRNFVSKNAPLVCTDKWRAYSSLKKEGYAHEQINHSANFVRPKKNAQNKKRGKRNRKYDLVNNFIVHTQSIENRWKHLKQRLRLKGAKRGDIMRCIYEALFYLSKRKKLFPKFIKIFQMLVLENK